jgi:hypothetical protein
VNRIARLSAAARAEIFSETAARKGLADAIVEKDFWVCWVLHQIFTIEEFAGRVLFKGGTSLSKVFHAINRFSEDLDLAVDYAALGFTGERDPRRQGLSKTKRTAILEEMLDVCRGYVAGEFLAALGARFRDVLGETSWNLAVDPRDPNILQFIYPAAVTRSLTYIAPQVTLELGTHAEFVPHDRFTIQSFVAEEYPDLVEPRDITVLALLARRTFWEKVTILHAEFHRPAEKPLPARYSRHYYDVGQLALGSIRGEALADRGLLADVVRHKQIFYPSAWARYDLACPGSLHLAPHASRIAALERDYGHMRGMLFGEPPEFGAIMQILTDLEREVNK